MNQTALRIEGVEKSFGSVPVLRGVTMDVQRGAVQAIIGPNGAGKSTLVNVLSGVLRATGGRIMLGEHDLTKMPAHRIARLGLIRTFQLTSLFDDLTVREHLAVACVLSGRRNSTRSPAERVVCKELLESLGLEALAQTKAAALSHGDKRLLEVALALARAPELLVMDEPTAGMSALETERMIRIINAQLRRRVTLILVEHDMNVVMRTADRITVLAEGRVLAEGTPTEIRADARVRDVYLGSTYGT